VHTSCWLVTSKNELQQKKPSFLGARNCNNCNESNASSAKQSHNEMHSTFFGALLQPRKDKKK
jgi:hypothetical protein